MNTIESQFSARRVNIDMALSDDINLSHSDEANVSVTRPKQTPLSITEPHVTLKISTAKNVGDTIEVTLDGEQLDALADAIHHVQEFHMEGGPDDE